MNTEVAPFPHLPPASGAQREVRLTGNPVSDLRIENELALSEPETASMDMQQAECIMSIAKRMDAIASIFRQFASLQEGAERVYLDELANESWRIHELLQELALSERE